MDHEVILFDLIPSGAEIVLHRIEFLRLWGLARSPFSKASKASKAKKEGRIPRVNDRKANNSGA